MSLFNGKNREEKLLSRIDEYEDFQNVKGLIKLLKDPSPAVVAKTLTSLGTLSTKSCYEDIISEGGPEAAAPFLSSRYREIRSQAARLMCWLTKKKGADIIVQTSSAKPLADLLIDRDRDTVRYAVAALYELPRRGYSDHVIYADGLAKMGKVLLNGDDYMRSFVIKSLTDISSQGYGAEVVRTGCARVLLITSQSNNANIRTLCKESIATLSESLGYSDPDLFMDRLDDIEGQFGKSADYSDISHHDAGLYSGLTSQIESASHPADEEFEIQDDQAVRMEPDEKDEDFVLYSVDTTVFPFDVLAKRLNDIRKLVNEGVISIQEYNSMKHDLLNELSVTVRLECMDCYEILGIEHFASEENIKKAYRSLATQYHPDKVAEMGDKLKELAAEEMKKLNYARETLLDRQKRTMHHMELRRKGIIQDH